MIIEWRLDLATFPHNVNYLRSNDANVVMSPQHQLDVTTMSMSDPFHSATVTQSVCSTQTDQVPLPNQRSR